MSKQCFIVHTGWGYDVFTTKKGALDCVFGTARKVVEYCPYGGSDIIHTRSSAEKELREMRQVSLWSEILITPSDLWNKNQLVRLNMGDFENVEVVE